MMLACCLLLTRPTVSLDFVWYSSDWTFLAYPWAVALCFALAWYLVGRDPKPGNIVIRYEPPAMSPAEARYLLTGANDRKSIAATLVNLDAQGVIALRPERGGYFVEPRTDAVPVSVSDEEHAFFVKLFDGTAPTGEPKSVAGVHLSADDMALYSTLTVALRDELFARRTRLYVNQNAGAVLGVSVMAMIVGLIIAANIPSSTGIVFLTFWVMMFSTILGMITVISVLPAWVDAVRGRLRRENVLKVTLPMLLFYGMPLFVAYIIGRHSQQGFAVALVLTMLVIICGGCVMKKVTPLGRQRLDEIAGYRTFLEAVERDPMERLNHPEVPPVTEGEELAWAIALEVKQSWGDKLADMAFDGTVAG